MSNTERVKGHSGFDHKIKIIQSRETINTKYINEKSGVDMISFLCSPKYTGDYKNLPVEFYTKIKRSMNYFDSLGSIIATLKLEHKELYLLLESEILQKISKFKDKKNSVNTLIIKVTELSNYTEEKIIELIDGYSKLKKVEEDTKKNTSNTLDNKDSESDSEKG